MKHVSKSALIDATLVCLVIGFAIVAVTWSRPRGETASEKTSINQQ
jgi:hypothetical protein